NNPLSIAGAVAAEGSAFSVRDGGNYERTHYPMTLKVLPGETVELDLSIDLARIDAAAAQRVLSHVVTLLEAMAAHPQARLGEIELLAPAERKIILAMGRGPETVLPASVHQQILVRASVSP